MEMRPARTTCISGKRDYIASFYLQTIFARREVYGKRFLFILFVLNNFGDFLVELLEMHIDTSIPIRVINVECVASTANLHSCARNITICNSIYGMSCGLFGPIIRSCMKMIRPEFTEASRSLGC